MHIRSSVFLLMFLLLLFTGPSRAADDKSCTSGNAKITEENRRFSVLVPKSSGLGHDQSYDDIGCAVMARNEECAMRQSMFDSAAMAYDYINGTEFPAEKMFFVLRTDVKTPRGFGIVAFKDKAEAETFSARRGKGKVVKWFQLVDEPLK